MFRLEGSFAMTFSIKKHFPSCLRILSRPRSAKTWKSLHLRAVAILSIGVLAGAFALGAEAQDPEDPSISGIAAAQARGLEVDSAFQFGDIDAINLFNGNLNLQIPLGQRYPVGAGLSYGLDLVYNSNAWRHVEHCTVTGSGGAPINTFEIEVGYERPVMTANAGLGWKVDPGRILVRGNSVAGSPNEPSPERLTYVAPDGSEHAFFGTLHSGDTLIADQAFTMDSSYLRLQAFPAGCMATDPSGLAVNISACNQLQVDFPDGSKHSFTNLGQSAPVTANEWRLSKMEDAYGNKVDVTYGVDPANSAIHVWTLKDDFGREQKIRLVGPQHDAQGNLYTNPPEAEQGLRVIDVTLTGFGGTELKYRFDYVRQFIERFKAGDNTAPEYTCNSSPQESFSLEVFLLSQVTALEGSTELLGYDFYYHLGFEEFDDEFDETTQGPNLTGARSGALSHLRLPTGGGYAYTYGVYPHGDDFSTVRLSLPPEQERIKRVDSIGVRRKYRLSSVSSADPTAAIIDGAWKYTTSQPMGVEAPWDVYSNYPEDLEPKPRGFQLCYMENRVSDPEGNETVHYFNTARVGFAREFGLPYTVCHPDTGVFFDLNGDGTRDYAQDPLVFFPSMVGGEDAERYPTSGPAPTRFLSSRVLGPPDSNGDSPVLREEYVLYDLDELPETFRSLLPLRTGSNSRVRESETCYLDDPGTVPASFCGNFHWRKTLRSDFDGFGNYRRIFSNSSFAGPDSLETLTNYNPAVQNESYPWPPGYADDPNKVLTTQAFASRSWILGLYPWSETDYLPNTTGDIATTLYCFDESTGFLEGRRVLAEDGHGANLPPQPGNDDLLVRFSPTTSGPGNLGFVEREEYFGGDGQALGGNTCGAPGALSPEYAIEATYQSGSLKRAYFADGAGEFLEVGDFLVDLNTGLASSSFDPSGVEVRFEYDALSRPVELCRPGVGVTVNEFVLPSSGASILQSEVHSQTFNASNTGCAAGPRIGEEKAIYDNHGRLVKEMRRLPRRSSGNNYTSILAERSFELDALGRVIKAGLWTEPGGGMSDSFEESLGYDSFGRSLGIQQPDGSFINRSYIGDRVEETRVRILDAPGTYTQSLEQLYRDGLGNLFQVENRKSVGGALQLRTTYRYDEGGRLVRVCVNDSDGDGDALSCGGGQTRIFEYDGRGLLISEQHPELGDVNGNGTDRYFYDSRGNLVDKVASEAAFHLAYRYDPAGRVTQVFAPQTETLLKEFFYGRRNEGAGSDEDRRTGRLVMARRHNFISAEGELAPPVVVTERFHYRDRGGRLSEYSVRSSDGASFSSSVDAYDAADNIVSLTYPQCDHLPCEEGGEGPPRTFQYDLRDGLPVGVSTTLNGQNSAVASGLDYHHDGSLARFGHLNGVTETWAQDSHDWRLGQITAAGITGGDWIYGPFAYDDAGNVTHIGSQQSYLYDLLNRLREGSVEVPLPSGGGTGRAIQRATYDFYGNLESLESAGDVAGPNPGDLIVEGSTNRLMAFGYDSNGNVTGGTLGSQAVTYRWDRFNRMRSMTAGSFDRQFLYTASGERFATLNPALGDETYTPRSASNQVLRRFKKLGTQPLVWDQDYVWVGSRQAGTIQPDPNGGETTRHFHTDHLGSVLRITDANADPVEERYLYPFGGEVFQPPADPEEFHFAGHERDINLVDASASLDYMHARFYSPYLGRFLSMDPDPGRVGIRQDGWNLYTYGANSPVKNVDPDGQAVLGLIKKGVKVAIKGGNVAAAFAGAIEDTKTLFARDSTFLERVGAGLSLATEIASPVSAREVKAGAQVLGVIDDAADSGRAARRATNSGRSATRAADTQGGSSRPTRQRGDRFTDSDDSLQQLEEIEEMQKRSRQGKADVLIESIEKSKQRLQNELNRIKTLEDIKE